MDVWVGDILIPTEAWIVLAVLATTFLVQWGVKMARSSNNRQQPPARIDPWTEELAVQSARQLTNYELEEMRNREDIRRFTIVVLIVSAVLLLFGGIMVVFYRIDKGPDAFWDTMGKIFLFGGGAGMVLILFIVATKLNVMVQRSDNGPLQAQAEAHAQSQKAVWAVFGWMLQNQMSNTGNGVSLPAMLAPPAGVMDQTQLSAPPVGGFLGGPGQMQGQFTGQPNGQYIGPASAPVSYGQSSQMGLQGQADDDEADWNA